MKGRRSIGLGLFSLAPVLGRRRRGRAGAVLGRLTAVGGPRRSVGVDEASRRWLMYFVVPLWLGAGLLDWAHHRRTGIERTAGTRESVIHALMLAEGGLPAFLGLFLEVNAGVLLAAVAAFLAHEATALWDVAYAESRRRVTPSEQHVHSFLEITPLMGLSFLTVLHWDQARALVGAGGDRPRFALEPKRRPLSRRYVASLLAAIGAFGVLPYAEEFWRCYRVDRTLAPRPEPPLPATPTLRVPQG